MIERYAVYYTFDGALGAFGAKWLGWDIETGKDVMHPRIDGFDLAQLTARPRRYGFHATIKAPFQLAVDQTEQDLKAAFRALCASRDPVMANGMKVQQIGRFLAFTIDGEDTAIKSLAAETVKSLDKFRAPLTAQDLEQRQAHRLTPKQRALLDQWGYPHVMDAFRFHLTLTGTIKDPALDATRTMTERAFAPFLPSPFTLGHLTLVGQTADGKFREINRIKLGD